MPVHNGKFVSGHLKNHPANMKPKAPVEHASSKMPEHGMPESQNHSEPIKTEPHPVTGVHKITMHHVGGGRFVSQTHHEASGEPEQNQHDNASEANQHMEQHFPNEEHNEEPPSDEESQSISGDLQGLGSDETE